MGAIAAAGFTFIITLVISVVIAMIGLFLGHIIIFDSIALALIGGAVVHNVWGIRTLFAIGIGVGIFFVLMFLQMTGPGFWIIGTLLSIVWGFIFGFIAWSLMERSELALYGVWVLGTGFMIFQHLRSRRNIEYL